MELHSNGIPLALPTNIILRWNWIAAANTLAYFDYAKNTSVKGLLYKHLRVQQTLDDLMKLHHSPDANTFPGFKLTCFVYVIICFLDR